MKMKKLALVLMSIACLIGSTAMAADTMTIKSASTENEAVVQVKRAKDNNFYQYYNASYGYIIDIPKSATQADETASGDGCYFQDPKDKSMFIVYASKNTLGFSIDELCNVDLNTNENPELITNIKTKNSYAISWTDGKKTYYHELYLTNNGQSYTMFSVVYPSNLKDKYDKIISHMTRSFVPSGVRM